MRRADELARSDFELPGGGFQVRRGAELGGVGGLDLELFAGRLNSAGACCEFADGECLHSAQRKASLCAHAGVDQLHKTINLDPRLGLRTSAAAARSFIRSLFFMSLQGKQTGRCRGKGASSRHAVLSGSPCIASLQQVRTHANAVRYVAHLRKRPLTALARIFHQ